MTKNLRARITVWTFRELWKTSNLSARQYWQAKSIYKFWLHCTVSRYPKWNQERFRNRKQKWGYLYLKLVKFFLKYTSFKYLIQYHLLSWNSYKTCWRYFRQSSRHYFRRRSTRLFWFNRTCRSCHSNVRIPPRFCSFDDKSRRNYALKVIIT